MGLLYPELSLDLKPSYVPDTFNGFLRQLTSIADVSERLEKVDDFVRRLEDEMKKIEVFKRELPLCVLLLRDAISFLKQEATQIKTRNAHQPVLEEFIPLKKESTAGGSTQMNKPDDEDYSRDKKNWMSSVQLWNADDFPTRTSNTSDLSCNQNQRQTVNLVSECHKGDDKRNEVVGDDLYDPSKNKAGSKGFVPMIHSYPTFPELRRKVDKEDLSVPGISLLVPGTIKRPREGPISRALNSKLGGTRVFNSSSPASSGRPAHQQTTARKQRRCWSPELHRRFIDALTQLGGAQVATPKQIRELMKVDGLTNDEVKSHLQKYRLHTRRAPNDSAKEKGNGLGGSWATEDEYNDSSKPSNSQSRSPQGPLQFPGLTGGTSTTGGDSMEDEDDDKSESHSWKAKEDV